MGLVQLCYTATSGAAYSSRDSTMEVCRENKLCCDISLAYNQALVFQ